MSQEIIGQKSKGGQARSSPHPCTHTCPESHKEIYAKLSDKTDKHRSWTSLASNRHICKKADGTAWQSHEVPWKTMKCKDPPLLTALTCSFDPATRSSLEQCGDIVSCPEEEEAASEGGGRRARKREREKPHHAQTCAGERSDLMVEKCMCARCPERRAQGDWEHKNRVWTKVKTNEERDLLVLYATVRSLMTLYQVSFLHYGLVRLSHMTHETSDH